MRSCFAVRVWPVAAVCGTAPALDVRQRRRAESGEDGLGERPTIH